MRSDVVRLYKVVHTWTGITAGMFLFIAFYAGSITENCRAARALGFIPRSSPPHRACSIG
jgi:hypothetical protein